MRTEVPISDQRPSRWQRHRLLVLAVGVLLGSLVGTEAAVAQQAGTVTGRVVNDAGAPIAGAQIVLVGTQRGTITNARGAFLMPNVPAGERQVQAMMVGYQTVTRTVQVVAGQTATVEFQLGVSAIALDEVVVTGQATAATRREVGTSIASIDASSLESAPVQSMSQMLQARSPGVNILPGGGKAGQGTRIVLRGAASVTQSNEPIIYVDGVRIDDSSVGAITSTTEGATWSGLDDINPEDIERVEIVRGASAATLYGTEAAAGVIQIFTKRGSEGAPTWTYSGEAGLLHTPLEWWDITEYSPWFYDNMVTTGNTQSHQLSVRGGAENVNYFASAGFRDENGILQDDAQTAYSFRLNLGLVPRENLSVRFNTSFNSRTIRAIPDANNQQGYTINGLVGGPAGHFMPTQSLRSIEAFQEGTRFLGGVTVEHAFSSALSHRVTFGVDVWNQDQHQLFPYRGIQRYPEGRRTDYRRESRNITVDYAATARMALTDDIRSTTAVGFQYLDHDVGSVTASGDDFPFYGLETVSGTLRTTAAESRSQQKSAGFFAEQQFGFRDYLFVTVGARADGHSAFGSDVDYQIYPKVSASYVLSDHLTMPEMLGTLRLRGAYGTAGQQPANFAAVRSWSATSAIGGQPGVIPTNIGNPDLKPEVTHEIELGLEAGILRDRLNIDVTRYIQNTRDALYSVREPPSQGFLSTQLRNVGEIRNEGWEIGSRATILDGVRMPFGLPELRWEAHANISTNENEIVSLGGGAQIQLQWLQYMREGYPVGALFGDRPIERDGVIGMASDLLRDADGNLPEGWDYVGPPLPTRTIQLGSTFNLGSRTTFGFLFDHRGGAYAQSSTLRWIMGQNITESRLDAHEALGFPDVATPGPVARACRGAEGMQQYLCERPNSALTVADFAVPIDFWKLREVSVSYRVPESIPERIGLSSLTLNLAGRNLWRTTDYMGLEPEGMYRNDLSDSAVRSQTFFDTPIPRHFTLGVRAQF